MTSSDKCTATTSAMTNADIQTTTSQPLDTAMDTNNSEQTEEETESITIPLPLPNSTNSIAHPKEYLDGVWEADPFYYGQNGTSSSKPGDDGATKRGKEKVTHRGMLYRSRVDDEYKCFLDKEGNLYRAGDTVFIDTQQPTEPYLIGCINMFKTIKRDQLVVKITRYFRPNDVPEVSYSLAMQDRKDLGHMDKNKAGVERVLKRELFSSEVHALHPIALLRGKCRIKIVKDIRSLGASCLLQSTSNCPISPAPPLINSSLKSNFEARKTQELNLRLSTKPLPEASEIEEDEDLLKKEDTFFTCLSFNQDTSRLASVQGLIRVGPLFQAKLPPPSTSTLSDEPDRDEMLFEPGHLCPESEFQYLKVVQTFRTFRLTVNKTVTSLEQNSRCKDLLLDDALLHRCGYNVVDAIKMMHANDELTTMDSCSFMSSEDVKKFGKGIKTFGKFFNRIKQELLPSHQRDQLVAFYYLWKKSSHAMHIRPKPLHRRAAGVGRRLRPANKDNFANGNAKSGTTSPMPRNGGPLTMPANEELLDYASSSEWETKELKEEERACHHCFSSSSKDWHHAGKDRLLMCTDCRIFFKKYGQLRPVDRPATVPICLFKSPSSSRLSPNDEQENDEPLGVRTRGAGRAKERRRTPIGLDICNGNYNDLKTPTKAEILAQNENSGIERRTTPQRSAKMRKRHRGSTAGLEESPNFATPKKQAKTGSQTPSPPPVIESTSKMLNSSSLVDSSNKLENGTQLEKPETNSENKKKQDNSTINGNKFNLTNGNSLMQSNSPTKNLDLKKPVAKVEPLDPNEAGDVHIINGVKRSATKTTLIAPATKLIKNEPRDSPKLIDSNGQNLNGQIETDDSKVNLIVADAEKSDKPLETNLIDNSPYGEEDNSDVPLKDGKQNSCIRRLIKRISKVTCARTDIGYIDSPTSRWSEEREKIKQQQILKEMQKPQALMQQQLNASRNKPLQNDNLFQQGSSTTPASNLPQHTLPEAQGLDPVTAALLMGNNPARWAQNPNIMALAAAQQQAAGTQNITQQQQQLAAQMAMAQFDPRLAALLPQQQLSHFLLGMEQQKLDMQRQQQQRQQQIMPNSLNTNNPVASTSNCQGTNSHKNSLAGQSSIPQHMVVNFFYIFIFI